MHVSAESTFGSTVRMADIVTAYFALAANDTYFAHRKHLLKIFDLPEQDIVELGVHSCFGRSYERKHVQCIRQNYGN